jgi:hypothetical protein
MLKYAFFAAAILVPMTSTAALAVSGFPTGKRQHIPFSWSASVVSPTAHKASIRSISRARPFGDGSVRFRVDSQPAGTPIASVTDMVLDPFNPNRRFQGVVSRFSQGRRW